jgi:hypothetical protein
MKVDLQTALGIAGLTVTLAFGYWSFATGKINSSKRYLKLFIALGVLFGGQFAANELLGMPLLPAPISIAIILMVSWLMYLGMRQPEDKTEEAAGSKTH